MLSLSTFLSLRCAKQCLGPLHLGLGVFLSDVAVVDAQGHAALQDTVINAGVSQVNGIFELIQGQVGGYDQGLAAALAAVDHIEHLLQGKLGIALDAQVVQD